MLALTKKSTHLRLIHDDLGKIFKNDLHGSDMAVISSSLLYDSGHEPAFQFWLSSARYCAECCNTWDLTSLQHLRGIDERDSWSLYLKDYCIVLFEAIWKLHMAGVQTQHQRSTTRRMDIYSKTWRGDSQLTDLLPQQLYALNKIICSRERTAWTSKAWFRVLVQLMAALT